MELQRPHEPQKSIKAPLTVRHDDDIDSFVFAIQPPLDFDPLLIILRFTAVVGTSHYTLHQLVAFPTFRPRLEPTNLTPPPPLLQVGFCGNNRLHTNAPLAAAPMWGPKC